MNTIGPRIAASNVCKITMVRAHNSGPCVSSYLNTPPRAKRGTPIPRELWIFRTCSVTVPKDLWLVRLLYPHYFEYLGVLTVRERINDTINNINIHYSTIYNTRSKYWIKDTNTLQGDPTGESYSTRARESPVDGTRLWMMIECLSTLYSTVCSTLTWILPPSQRIALDTSKKELTFPALDSVGLNNCACGGF
jgi:hypothetical protein